jgi:NAD(P)-dependent dehydrogenase (short-subunit alcohol dehydrogenase family)
MEIQGKVAIVTGAAKRVGKAIALALAGRGAHIVVHYRSSASEAEKTAQAVRAMGVRAELVRGDLSSAKQAAGVVSQTLRRFGWVDILVNSASLYVRTPFGKISEKDWDAHLDTNLKGIFFLSQAAGTAMLRKKSGKIVNIIDSDVTHPYLHYAPYLVSKSGLVGLTYCLAKELAPHVQVNGVSPGPVVLPPDWGPKVKKAIIRATPLARIGDPQDIANGVLFCVEGTDFMTGAVIPIDGGQHIA